MTSRSDVQETADAQYRAEIDKFAAYLSFKECDSLIEGFFASGHLVDVLRCPKFGESVVVGLTGSIGRREANTAHSDYDVAVIAGTGEVRDSAVSKLMRLNPQAKLERRELFKVGPPQPPDSEKLKDEYYPFIDPDSILKEGALFHRVWLLTEFTPLIENRLYQELQKTLMDYYKLFSHRSLYANPSALLDDILSYPSAFARSLEKTAYAQENEQPGLTTHAKTIMLRKFAHLFHTLTVVRTVCRKYQIMSTSSDSARNREIFLSLRAPTLIQIGYWFSDEFHFERPMRRFDSEKDISSSREVFNRYIEFLKSEEPKYPGARGKVIHKMCEPLEGVTGLVRRLFKRTSVELIENYNEGRKRIWTGCVREYLSGIKPNPSHILKSEAEFDNIKELSDRVVWPLYALANLLRITFEVAGEWSYFEGETYKYSGRKQATDCLVDETRKMLVAAASAGHA